VGVEARGRLTLRTLVEVNRVRVIRLAEYAFEDKPDHLRPQSGTWSLRVAAEEAYFKVAFPV